MGWDGIDGMGWDGMGCSHALGVGVGVALSMPAYSVDVSTRRLSLQYVR